MLQPCGLRRVAVISLLLPAAATLNALERPTAEQVREYQADGTWAARLARARALGNHQADPELVAQMRSRLERQVALAAGLPVADENALPSGRQGGLPAKGAVKTLVILVDFPDYPHTAGQTVADVQNKFFGNGDAGQYPYESLRNYYQRSSYNQLTITGNVLGWYRAANNRSYYEGLGDGPGQRALITEAMNYFDAQGHDFTQYDNDGDGRLDSFFLKWTGPDNGWSNFWWAYQTSWPSSSSYRIDGKRLRRHVWSWIANPPSGNFQPRVDIHETGHLLGLPDYYDYDDSIGPRGGVGGLDMMDANRGDHCCFSKFLLEWLAPTVIISGAQTIALNPSGTSKDCVLIMPGYVPGTYFDEFFMAQYRKRNVGNDTSSYPTDGLTLWHIDSSLSGSGFRYDNSSTAHKLIRLMEADGLEEIETSAASADAGDFYVAPKVFGPTGTPNSADYAGAATGVLVYNLMAAGTTMGVSFSIVTQPRILAAGASITSESCAAHNGVLDPGETVGVEFWLLNAGSTNTTNLVATLQATGGVTSPSGPQTYGATSPGSPAVGRSFTFVPSGACGSTITATLQLKDGNTTYPAATFQFTLGQQTPMGFYVCCGLNVGDFDGDGDADQEDFGRLQECMSGPQAQNEPTCLPGRLDGDADVDQVDMSIFRRCHGPPGFVPDPGCRNP